MKNFKINKDMISIIDQEISWQDAIKMSSKPLLDKEYINEDYVKAMIDSVDQYGPYIVIDENIALPHARPEFGSQKIGFSIMLNQKAVEFPENYYAKLFIALSCVDDTKHVKMLQYIVTILSDANKKNLLLNAKTVDDILLVFQSNEELQ